MRIRGSQQVTVSLYKGNIFEVLRIHTRYGALKNEKTTNSHNHTINRTSVSSLPLFIKD